MIIMIPHAIDIVHGKAGMTIDTIPGASAAIETTTTSAIGMITATDMSAPPGGRGAHANVAIVAAAGPGPGESISNVHSPTPVLTAPTQKSFSAADRG